ncbi:MAG: dienelactone hydrolase family protein [Bacteroidota bacterium]
MRNLLFILLAFLGSCTARNQAVEEARTSVPALGTQQFIWIDGVRVDDYYGGNRLINAQVWYPAQPSESDYQRASYYFKIDSAFAHLENWTASDLKLVNAVNVNARMDAPLKHPPKTYPLIIFSPSLGGNLSQYTFYAERLAEKGYITMGINHLYESEYVLDSDGRTIVANHSFHDSLKALNIPEQISADRYREVKGVRQKVIGEDIILGLDILLKHPLFRDAVDTSKIGVFGHSIGGAGAVYASLLDRRIKAVINLDGTPPTLALHNGIDVPFLFIEDLTDYENHQGYAKLHLRRNTFCERNRKESWRILIGDANHNSFLDLNYFLAEEGEEKIHAYHFLQQTEKYMRSFFDHHLRSMPLDITAMKSDSLEIIRFKK